MDVLRVFTNRSSASGVLEWFVWSGSNLYSNSDTVELSQEHDRIRVRTDVCFEFNRCGPADKIKPAPLASAIVGVATTLGFINALTSLTCVSSAYRYSPGELKPKRITTDLDNWLVTGNAVISQHPLMVLGLDKLRNRDRVFGGSHEFTITDKLLDPTKLRDNGTSAVDVDFVDAAVNRLTTGIVGTGPFYINAYYEGELVSVVEIHDKLQRVLSAVDTADSECIGMLRREYTKCYNILFINHDD